MMRKIVVFSGAGLSAESGIPTLEAKELMDEVDALKVRLGEECPYSYRVEGKVKKKKTLHKKHWYKQFTTECPVCGRGETIRERMYGEKPKNPEEIYSFESYYDSCMSY